MFNVAFASIRPDAYTVGQSKGGKGGGGEGGLSTAGESGGGNEGGGADGGGGEGGGGEGCGGVGGGEGGGGEGGGGEGGGGNFDAEELAPPEPPPTPARPDLLDLTCRHGSGWTPAEHFGDCGQSCGCCRARAGEALGACTVCGEAYQGLPHPTAACPRRPAREVSQAPAGAGEADDPTLTSAAEPPPTPAPRPAREVPQFGLGPVRVRLSAFARNLLAELIRILRCNGTFSIVYCALIHAILGSGYYQDEAEAWAEIGGEAWDHLLSAYRDFAGRSPVLCSIMVPCSSGHTLFVGMRSMEFPYIPAAPEAQEPDFYEPWPLMHAGRLTQEGFLGQCPHLFQHLQQLIVRMCQNTSSVAPAAPAVAPPATPPPPTDPSAPQSASELQQLGVPAGAAQEIVEEAMLMAEAAAEQQEDGRARAAAARREQVLHEGCAESLAEGRGPDGPDSPGEPTGAAVLEHSMRAVDASRRADAADEVAAAPTQLPPLHAAVMAVLAQLQQQGALSSLVAGTSPVVGLPVAAAPPAVAEPLAPGEAGGGGGGEAVGGGGDGEAGGGGGGGDTEGGGGEAAAETAAAATAAAGERRSLRQVRPAPRFHDSDWALAGRNSLTENRADGRADGPSRRPRAGSVAGEGRRQRPRHD